MVVSLSSTIIYSAEKNYFDTERGQHLSRESLINQLLLNISNIEDIYVKENNKYVNVQKLYEAGFQAHVKYMKENNIKNSNELKDHLEEPENKKEFEYVWKEARDSVDRKVLEEIEAPLEVIEIY